jgi:small nuclear ribonucleoprotein (snRNP)-like protein
MEDTCADVAAVSKTEGRMKLESWLNRSLKIQMTDGRTLIGVFVCTDRDRNVILGSCQEYLHYPDDSDKEEPRMLGLALVPGRHVVSVCIDDNVTV